MYCAPPFAGLPTTAFHGAGNCAFPGDVLGARTLYERRLLDALISALLIAFAGGCRGRLMSMNNTTHSRSVRVCAECR
jgi:hypothetical protein